MISQAPRLQQMTPFRDKAVLQRIHDYEGREKIRDRYYWHQESGHRYCHYYDRSGYHWYGWYAGDDFYWTRYYYGRWWWYDTRFDRWCYWHGDDWWWQGPQGVVYIHVNDDYRSAEETVAPSVNSDVNHTEYWASSDNRVVKVFGGDAFLYDTSYNPLFDPIFLSSDVADVKFAKPKGGRVLQIMLTLEDGSFRLFDGRGRPF
jgi:hypothetical protein